MLRIYHNPRCRKSREALQLVKDNSSEDIEIIEYLKNPPTKQELSEVLKMLELSVVDLLRKTESEYKELIKGKNHSEDALLKIVVQNPKLIERPIIIKEGRAVIGRPPEKVLELL